MRFEVVAGKFTDTSGKKHTKGMRVHSEADLCAKYPNKFRNLSMEGNESGTEALDDARMTIKRLEAKIAGMEQSGTPEEVRILEAQIEELQMEAESTGDSDSSGLIKELKQTIKDLLEENKKLKASSGSSDCQEALDEVASLKEENAELVEALATVKGNLKKAKRALKAKTTTKKSSRSA